MINRERILSEFAELVEIDAPSFGERKIADCLKKKLEVMGFQVTEDEAGKAYDSDCGNVYGYLPGELQGSPLLFSAHMDTVPPAYGKKAILQSDGRITSAGNTVLGADDVAGIVAILEAIRSIREDKLPHRSIEVLFPVAEEVYAMGSNLIDYSKVIAKEAYVLDLDQRIGTAAYMAPSILSFTAEVLGKSAHAGFCPEEGIHSIQIAARIISGMKLGRIDEDATVNVGTITGGAATNIIPKSCKIEGEIRCFNHEKAMAMLEEIKQLFLSETKQSGADLNWEEQINCIAYATDLGGNAAERYRAACSKEGIQAEFIKTFGGSDYNVFAVHGIEGLVLSNAMHKVHSCEEYTDIEELIQSTQVVRNLMT